MGYEEFGARNIYEERVWYVLHNYASRVADIKAMILKK
jgi:hypothetical protein